MAKSSRLPQNLGRARSPHAQRPVCWESHRLTLDCRDHTRTLLLSPPIIRSPSPWTSLQSRCVYRQRRQWAEDLSDGQKGKNQRAECSLVSLEMLAKRALNERNKTGESKEQRLRERKGWLWSLNLLGSGAALGHGV